MSFDMPLPDKTDVRNPAPQASGPTFLTKPAPKDRFPNDGIGRAAAYQLIHDELLLDGNALAEGKKYFRIGNFAVSPNHGLLAYSIDYEGDEAYTIRVKNLATGSLLRDHATFSGVIRVAEP